MKPKKFTATFFCITLVLLMILSSCGPANNSVSGTTDTSGDTLAPANNDQPSTEENRANTPDSLPAGLDFNGETFNILSRSEFNYGTEMGVDDENGEIVNDTTYTRNKNVEDRLNCKINVIKIKGIWGEEQNFNNTVKKSVKAGDNSYDLVAGYAYFITPLASEGNFLNLKTVPYLDFEQPWWCADLADKISIDDKLYFMSGDLSLTMIQSLMVTYFNKRIQKDYNVEDLYQLVLDGKWTYEKMNEICKGIYTDVNGDSKKDDGDLYGAAIEMGNYNDAFIFSQNQPITLKGDDGYPQLAVDSSKTIDIVNRMYDLFYNNTGVYAVTETQERPSKTMFANGQALFNWGLLSFTEDLRTMKDDYGIIPFPKYDESQENYISLAQDAYSLFCIPATNTRLEMVGAVTEAMAAESYRILTPAYYETALKIKYSRDDVTSQMLDIIRDGVSFDFACVNSSSMGNMIHLFRELMNNKSKDFVSAYQKKEATYQKGLDSLVDAYKALN